MVDGFTPDSDILEEIVVRLNDVEEGRRIIIGGRQYSPSDLINHLRLGTPIGIELYEAHCIMKDISYSKRQ